MRPLKDVELPPEVIRRRMISVPQAADLRGISEDTFKRKYPHLIKKLSERRNGVTLADVLALDEPAK
jgi:hypothetical protein